MPREYGRCAAPCCSGTTASRNPSPAIFTAGCSAASGAEPAGTGRPSAVKRSEEHTSELQSLRHLGCRLLLEKKRHCCLSRLPQVLVAYGFVAESYWFAQ